MDDRIRDDSLNLDSSGTIELGRNPVVQEAPAPAAPVEVLEPPRHRRCDTQQRELLGQAFGRE
jgi:hypothetical protein